MVVVAEQCAGGDAHHRAHRSAGKRADRSPVTAPISDCLEPAPRSSSAAAASAGAGAAADQDQSEDCRCASFILRELIMASMLRLVGN